MATYHYTAFNTAGERIVGSLAGASEQAVQAELESRALTPVQIKPQVSRRGLFSGIGKRALGTAYLQVADLLHAGVPLLRSLRLISRRKSQPKLAEVFAGLAEKVEDGGELADAMTQRPDIFDRIHIAMIRAGEKGGFLEQVLERLGKFVVAQADMRGKVLGNLIYPAVLVFFGLAVLGAIFAFFVPMFQPLYERIEGGLPGITVFVFGISELVGTYGPLTLIVVALLIAGVWRLSRSPINRRRLTVLRTRLPVFGPLTRALAAARFCRMLGTLLANGVPMIASMQIARDAAGNILLEEAIEEATEAVRGGESLAPPLAKADLFGDDVIEMISVGEAANNLDEVLVTIAETIEARVDRLLNAVVRLVEPLLLMSIASVVVTVAIALILPMTKLSTGM
ncbi:MAG: type II secretion system F family protein [Phycisphaerales bacterium JB037]